MLSWWRPVLILLVSAPLLFAQQPQKKIAPSDSTTLPSPRGAMIRSILFPGWGQYYNGKKWKAAFVFAAESGIVGSILYWNRRAEQAPDADHRALYLEYRNRGFWYLGLAILLSAGDAYVDAQLAGFDVSPDLSLLPGHQRFALVLSRQF